MSNVFDFPPPYRSKDEGGYSKKDGGDGTSGGMEGRVAKLEALTDVVRADVASLKVDTRDVRERLVRLEERVSHLPTKGFIITTTTTIFALLTGIVLFQGKLQGLLRLAG